MQYAINNKTMEIGNSLPQQCSQKGKGNVGQRRKTGRVFFISVISIFSMLLLSSCSEVIEWKVEDNRPRLVVESVVTNEYKKHSVYLSVSQDLYEESDSDGISDASITISDGENIYLLEEIPTQKGHYETVEFFAGEPGKTYVLDILLQEPLAGNQAYQAIAAMPNLLELDSIDVVKETFFGDEEYAVKVYGKVPGGTAVYYLIHVYRNEHLLTGDLEEAILIDNKVAKEGFDLDGISLYSHEDIQKDDNIMLEVLSVTEDYYTYILNLGDSKDGGDPLGLSGPPSNTFGNISNEAFGYFYAAPVSRLETVVTE